MKRRDLIKLLEANRWRLFRHGAGHDIYTDGKRCEPIPRYTETKEQLAKSIIRKYKLK